MTHVYINGRIILSGCLVINNKKKILLYRSDHHHYETPGGKVRLSECGNPDNPSINDLAKTAERELYEELGSDIEIRELEYFGNAKFNIPGGKLAVANKFVTNIISGKPKLNEPEKFSRYDYLPIENLEDYQISPDLQLLLPQLKEYAKTLV